MKTKTLLALTASFLGITLLAGTKPGLTLVKVTGGKLGNGISKTCEIDVEKWTLPFSSTIKTDILNQFADAHSEPIYTAETKKAQNPSEEIYIINTTLVPTSGRIDSTGKKIWDTPTYKTERFFLVEKASGYVFRNGKNSQALVKLIQNACN
jgi:hypothetical protein